MAKLYSTTEKEALLLAFASDGQRLAAFSRTCGVSVITLRNWQRAAHTTEMSGFEAIDRSDIEAWGGFRLSVGRATVECGSLPPAQWVCALIKGLSV